MEKKISITGPAADEIAQAVGVDSKSIICLRAYLPDGSEVVTYSLVVDSVTTHE